MTTSKALDLFSKQAAYYAKYRPSYPPLLFEFLLKHVSENELAWDVGTGNGQAATELAKSFKQVVATDISSGQISHAVQRPNIRYAVTPHILSPDVATTVVGPPGTVDLITVAQAIHWFEFESFFASAKLLLKHGGVMAAWGYGIPRVSAAMNSVLDDYYRYTHPYWEPQREHIDAEYATIPFDFQPLAGQETVGPIRFQSPVTMTLADIVGFLKSWSPYQTAKDRGIDLLQDWIPKFEAAWGEVEERAVTWPIFLIAGKK